MGASLLQRVLRGYSRIASPFHSTVSLVHVIEAPLYGMAPDGIAAAVDWAELETERVINQLQHDGVLDDSSLELTNRRALALELCFLRCD